VWRPNIELGFDVRDDAGSPTRVIRAGTVWLLAK